MVKYAKGAKKQKYVGRIEDWKKAENNISPANSINLGRETRGSGSWEGFSPWWTRL